MPFSATWMNLEMIILSEVRQKQISYDIIYKWNLKKNDKNELIYKTERDSQIQKKKEKKSNGYQRGKWGEE